MTFEERMSFLKNKWEANKMAIISDKKNNQYICTIDHNTTSSYFALSIDLHTLNQERIGFINIFRDPDNRLFLSTIYICWQYRGLKLATKLNNLSNFILKEEAGKIIRGRFAPYSDPKDIDLPGDLTKEEALFFAEKFYKSNGFQIINYKDFISAPETYPELTKWDFKFDVEPATTIIVNKIPKIQHPLFKEENGVITEIQPDEEMAK